MMSKLLTTVAAIIVLAIVFIGIGYAYTSVTENSDNTVTSQYVVLTQQNYNLTNLDLDFDIKETEAGVVYRLNSTSAPLISIDGITYCGVSIGTDKLTATTSGFTPSQPLEVSITSPQIDGSWFTDYSDYLMGWKYILEVSATAKETQYAFYDGAEDGIWTVKGKTVGSAYTVSGADANEGGYITLYKMDGGGRFTVVKIDSGGTAEVLTNKTVGDPVSCVGDWYVNGRSVINDYNVDADDADGGRVIVLYQTANETGYTVVKVDSNSVLLEHNKTAGETVSGVAGWMYGGGTKLNIEAGVEYETELFFAGSGVFSDASLRSMKTDIKAPSQVMIVPVWVPAGDTSLSNTVRYTLKPGVDQGGEGNDRIAYIISGGDLILPENVFTNKNGKTFVGWKSGDLDKVFTPWHVYSNNTQERTFTAQWAGDGEYFTVTFDVNGGQRTMADRYILKDVDSGNTFTLPFPEFSKAGYTHAGWTVTGVASGNTYGTGIAPFTDISAVKEDIAVKAEWYEDPVDCEHISIGNQENTVILVPSDGKVGDVNVSAWDVVQYSGSAWGIYIPETKTVAEINGMASPASGSIYKVSDNGTIEQGNLTVFSGYIVEYNESAWEVVASKTVREINGLSPASGDTYIVSGARLIRNLSNGDVVTNVDGWYVNGTIIHGDYAVSSTDAGPGGYITLYEEDNSTGIFDVVLVNGESVSVISERSADNEIDHVGGCKVKGAEIYGGTYYVRAPDAEAGGYIVLYNETNGPDKYTVVKVDNNGTATMFKNMSVGAEVTGVNGWYVKGESITNDYTVSSADATNGFIVIYQTANTSGKYDVIMVDRYTVTVKEDLASNDSVSDVRGWKVRGAEIGTYKVNASDAGPGGYIVLYHNTSFRYLQHTDAGGKYTLPYCVYAPPESVWKDAFTGWRLLGWSVSTSMDRLVPQALIMPYGAEGIIVNNGMIKFTYVSDPDNGND